MSFSKVYSAQTTLLSAHRIDIETDISRGLHNFAIIGLGDKAIDESRDRVSAAIKNSGFLSPKQRNQKVVISLAPAHIRKNGVLFDIAIALSYLKAVEEIDFNSEESLFFGELALDGKIRKINGVLPLVRFAKENNFKNVFLPEGNKLEASVISGINIYPAKDLKQIIDHLQETKLIKVYSQNLIPNIEKTEKITIDDISGQENAKRALTIAAAGRHNIALIGPPGTGKTLLAKAFASILPPLSFEEMLDVTSIHSVADTLEHTLVINPPIRMPHHTASYAAIFGGGTKIKPGEVTLAHKGVLFLDEFPEFEKRTIEGLRQPLEDKCINISRAEGSVKYPADFTLVATLNPCPCGYYGSSTGQCTCTMQTVQRYKDRLSGPIVDRIDIWITVPNTSHKEILSNKINPTNLAEKLKSEIIKARQIQNARFSKCNINTNGEMNVKNIKHFIKLSEDVERILLEASQKLNMSIRGCHKVMKVARTIADIEQSEIIEDRHILEALQYRPK